MNPPRVFISYSHDSAPHKEWVLDLATTLRNRGVDAILDQWDLRPGDDLPHFMERNLAESDYVLLVCSDNYVDKANSGEGGVGYEKMIVTASLLARIDSNKAIPIIRQKGAARVPTFLSSKLYIDFSRDEEVEYSLDELLRTLLDAPLYEKPPIGEATFEPMQGSRPDRTADGIKTVMEAVAAVYNESDSTYVDYGIARRLTDLHRLSFDRFLLEAERLRLVRRDHDGDIILQDAGKAYLFEHGIVK